MPIRSRHPRSILLTAVLASALVAQGQRELMSVKRSAVSFLSDAALERIEATNTYAVGAMDVQQRSFMVRIPMRSFEGFNSSLQAEHFQENYVESNTFPNATFEGRIIETFDLRTPGKQSVRAKGRFTLKGVSHERIIPCEVVVAADGVRVTTRFDVLLSDHGILIPRVVQQKINNTVKVQVDLLFTAAKVR